MTAGSASAGDLSGGLLGVSVLVSLEINLGLSAGQYSGLLCIVLVRVGVCWGSLSWPSDMYTGVLVLVMLNFCLRFLFWSSLRSLKDVWSGPLGIHRGSLC